MSLHVDAARWEALVSVGVAGDPRCHQPAARQRRGPGGAGALVLGGTPVLLAHAGRPDRLWQATRSEELTGGQVYRMWRSMTEAAPAGSDLAAGTPLVMEAISLSIMARPRLRSGSRYASIMAW